jgi:hypothetical protein
MILKPVFIIAIVAVAMIGVMVPSVFAELYVSEINDYVILIDDSWVVVEDVENQTMFVQGDSLPIIAYTILHDDVDYDSLGGSSGVPATSYSDSAIPRTGYETAMFRTITNMLYSYPFPSDYDQKFADTVVIDGKTAYQVAATYNVGSNPCSAVMTILPKDNSSWALYGLACGDNHTEKISDFQLYSKSFKFDLLAKERQLELEEEQRKEYQVKLEQQKKLNEKLYQERQRQELLEKQEKLEQQQEKERQEKFQQEKERQEWIKKSLFPPSNYMGYPFQLTGLDPYDPYEEGGLQPRMSQSYLIENTDYHLSIHATNYHRYYSELDSRFESARGDATMQLYSPDTIIEKNPLEGETCAKITGHFPNQYDRLVQSYVCTKMDYVLTAQLIGSAYGDAKYHQQALKDFTIYSLNNLEKMHETSKENGGGCLIATATYGSELAPQVQQLRELRDNQLMNTESGSAFMETFNDIYYSFSPTIADMEREHPMFKEAVKLAITPMISSLSLMENANSESEVLSIGISVIVLNLGMYLGVPAIVIVGIKKKLD